MPQHLAPSLPGLWQVWMHETTYSRKIQPSGCRPLLPALELPADTTAASPSRLHTPTVSAARRCRDDKDQQTLRAAIRTLDSHASRPLPAQLLHEAHEAWVVSRTDDVRPVQLHVCLTDSLPEQLRLTAPKARWWMGGPT